jgi:hypothetical protein
MKPCLFFTVLITLFPSTHSYCQEYFYNDSYYDRSLIVEAGLSLGVMNCLTDLGGNKGKGKKFLKDLNTRNSKPCFSIHFSALYEQLIGIRVEGTIGSVKADDAVLKKDHPASTLRHLRNLHFRSGIQELVMMAEFHPLALFLYKRPFLSPYLLAGTGVFHFNPEAEYKGEWARLQPLRTEGQGFPEYPDRKIYSLTQINFPMGIGAKYEISAVLNARLELLYRVLTTDYLDDVSHSYVDPAAFYRNMNPATAARATRFGDRRAELDPLFLSHPGDKRGNPGSNDSYFSLTLKLGVVLNRKRR